MLEEKIKNDVKNFSAQIAEERISKPVSNELVRYSNDAHESAYKISYEIAEVTLPPKISTPLERELRISTDKIKSENGKNLEKATVQIVTATTDTIIDVVSGDKNFDEASRQLVAQSKNVVKNVVIQKGKDIIIKEGQRIGGEVLKKVGMNIFKGSNPAMNALVFGDVMKNSVMALVEGKIDAEQFIKEVSRKCAVIALQTFVATTVPGGIFAGVAIEYACNAVFAKMDAAEYAIKDFWKASQNQAAADRRKVIEKIKSDALVEMKRQRDLMQKCFADEKLKWDSNVKAGFQLIAQGSYSNDVDVIAQGLDRILQNFGSQVAFSSKEDFRRDFRQRKIVLNL